MPRGTTLVVTRGTTNLINAGLTKGRFRKSCFKVQRLARIPEPTNYSFQKATWQQASGGARMLQPVSYEHDILFDFEEINMNPNNVQGPPPVGPNPQNHGPSGLNLQNPALDLRTMEELLQAPTDGVGDAIVVPPILANQFKLKIGFLNLVTTISFHGFANDDPHSHIRRFTKITQTIKLNQVPHDIIKLILLVFSLEGSARTWLEKEPPNCITTWNDLASKFVNQFFPPSRTTNLRNEITNFQQKFNETFSEAWD
ncbi:reverse transcriptase domain-containing protein [Tanacetum coccineum]